MTSYKKTREKGFEMNKTTWVTGGAGFLGSNLCRRLLAAGDRVVCIDNFSSGRPENVAELSGREDFVLLEADVAAPGEAFYALAEQAPPDRIYHLACPASPVFYQKSPVGTAVTCFEGAFNLLRVAEKTGARILLASTSEVYGEPELHPQPESYRGSVNSIGPRACYDEGKRISETLFFDFHREYGVDIRVVRIFNTYGPFMRADDGRVISNLLVQALKGEPLTVTGDGTQTRSFCYVSDLLEGLTRMMETEPQDGEALTGPVNLGNPEEYEIRALAEEICRVTGFSGEIRHTARPVDDPSRRRPDIGLAKRLLHWEPKVPLREGLARTAEYFREALKQQGAV